VIFRKGGVRTRERPRARETSPESEEHLPETGLTPGRQEVRVAERVNAKGHEQQPRRGKPPGAVARVSEIEDDAVRVHRPLRERTKRLDDLAVVGETPGRVFGENEFSICDNVEDAVPPRDQFGLNTQFSLQRGPQTGGTRKVVSANAVRNRNVHDLSPFTHRRVPFVVLRAHAATTGGDAPVQAHIVARRGPCGNRNKMLSWMLVLAGRRF
jgi:hypothetical protein